MFYVIFIAPFFIVGAYWLGYSTGRAHQAAERAQARRETIGEWAQREGLVKLNEHNPDCIDHAQTPNRSPLYGTRNLPTRKLDEEIERRVRYYGKRG